MKRIILLLAWATIAINAAMAQTYHPHDLGKLKAFIKQGNYLGLESSEVGLLDVSEDWVSKIRGITWTEAVPKQITKFNGGSGGEAGPGSGNFLFGTLDLSGCTALQSLDFDAVFSELSVDVSGCSALTEVYIGWFNYGVTSLNVDGCNALEILACQNTRLTSLDISSCTSLEILYCYSSQLSTLDLSKNPALKRLECEDNPLTDMTVGWTTIPSLDYLSLPDVSQATLHVPRGSAERYRAADKWEEFGTIVESVEVSQEYDAHDLGKLKAFLVQLAGYPEGMTNGECLGLSASEVAALGASVDWISKVGGLTWSASTPRRLERINWRGVGLAGVLDLSGCTSLSYLDVTSNRLTSLDVSGCVLLDYLWCSNNQFTYLGLSGCVLLRDLNCSDNILLTSLDISDCLALEELTCANTRLTALDLSANLLLKEFYCASNPLSEMTVGWSTWSEIDPNSDGVSDGMYIHNVSSATLYVPAGSASRYRITSPWSRFGRIVEVGSVSTAFLPSPPLVTVFVSDNTLSVLTPFSESLTLYSPSGSLLFRSSKLPGHATFTIGHLPKGVIIVKGSTGWVRKIINN
jgi:Leucine-rich repeat (LRR) protein